MLRLIAWETSGLARLLSSCASGMRSSSATSGNSKNASIGRLASTSQAIARPLGCSELGLASVRNRVNGVSAIVIGGSLADTCANGRACKSLLYVKAVLGQDLLPIR